MAVHDLGRGEGVGGPDMGEVEGVEVGSAEAVRQHDGHLAVGQPGAGEARHVEIGKV